MENHQISLTGECDDELHLLAQQEAVLDRVLLQQEEAKGLSESQSPQDSEGEAGLSEVPLNFGASQYFSTALQCVVPAATRWHCSNCTSVNAVTGLCLLVTKSVILLLDIRTAAVQALINCGTKTGPLAAVWALSAPSLAETLRGSSFSAEVSLEEPQCDQGEEEPEPGEVQEESGLDCGGNNLQVESPLPLCMGLEAVSQCFFSAHADKAVRLFKLERSVLPLRAKAKGAVWRVASLAVHRQHQSSVEALAVTSGCFLPLAVSEQTDASCAQQGAWLLCLSGDAKGKVVVWGLEGLQETAFENSSANQEEATCSGFNVQPPRQTAAPMFATVKKTLLFSLQPLHQKVSEVALLGRRCMRFTQHFYQRKKWHSCSALSSPLQKLAFESTNSSDAENGTARDWFFLAAVGYDSGAVLLLDLATRTVIANVGSLRDRVTSLLFLNAPSSSPPCEAETPSSPCANFEKESALLACGSRDLDVQIWKVSFSSEETASVHRSASHLVEALFRSRLDKRPMGASSVSAALSVKGPKNKKVSVEGGGGTARQWLTLSWHPACSDALFVGCPSGELLWISVKQAIRSGRECIEASAEKASEKGGRKRVVKIDARFKRLGHPHLRPLFSISCFAANLIKEEASSLEKDPATCLCLLTSSLDRTLALSVIDASSLATSAEASAPETSNTFCKVLWKVSCLGGWAECLSGSAKAPGQAWLGCGDSTLRTLDLSAAVKHQILQLKNLSPALPAIGEALLVMPSWVKHKASRLKPLTASLHLRPSEVEAENGEGCFLLRCKALCPGTPFESRVFWKQLLSGVVASEPHPQRPNLLAFGLVDGHFGLMDSTRATGELLSSKQALFAPAVSVCWLAVRPAAKLELLEEEEASQLDNSTEAPLCVKDCCDEISAENFEKCEKMFFVVAATQDGQLAIASHVEETTSVVEASPASLVCFIPNTLEKDASQKECLSQWELQTLRGALPLAVPFPEGLKAGLTSSLVAFLERALSPEAGRADWMFKWNLTTRGGARMLPIELLVVFECQTEAHTSSCISNNKDQGGGPTTSAEQGGLHVLVPLLQNGGRGQTSDLLFVSLGRLRLPLGRVTAAAVGRFEDSSFKDEALLAVGDGQGSLFVAPWKALLEQLLNELFKERPLACRTAAFAKAECSKFVLMTASDIECATLESEGLWKEGSEEEDFFREKETHGHARPRSSETVTSLSFASFSQTQLAAFAVFEEAPFLLLAVTSANGSASVLAVPPFQMQRKSLKVLAQLRACASYGLEKQASQQGQLLTCCWAAQLAPPKLWLLIGGVEQSVFLWDFRQLPFVPSDASPPKVKASGVSSSASDDKTRSVVSRRSHISFLDSQSFFLSYESLSALTLSPDRIARARQLLSRGGGCEAKSEGQTDAAEASGEEFEEEDSFAWLLLFLVGDQRQATRQRTAETLQKAASKAVRRAAPSPPLTVTSEMRVSLERRLKRAVLPGTQDSERDFTERLTRLWLEGLGAALYNGNAGLPWESSADRPAASASKKDEKAKKKDKALRTGDVRHWFHWFWFALACAATPTGTAQRDAIESLAASFVLESNSSSANCNLEIHCQAALLLALGRPFAAVQLYVHCGLSGHALLLARLKLPRSEPTVEEVFQVWLSELPEAQRTVNAGEQPEESADISSAVSGGGLSAPNERDVEAFIPNAEAGRVSRECLLALAADAVKASA